MLKIGVLGVGHLGKIHVKCIQQTTCFELIGFFDPDDESALQLTNNHNIKRFEKVEDLLDSVDVVDIVTPTVTHFELALKAIQKGKHVFIEKPLCNTIEEAATLLAACRKKGVKVQVGHVERFNPALLALENTKLTPMFIEAHRLAVFNPRGTDVSVILDLMIHDLDIVLSLVDSKVKGIHASGVRVVSDTPDIANVRLEFANGCVANLTASRISMKQMRKVRLFQPDAYISLDFLEKNTQVVRLYDEGSPDIPQDANLMDLQTNNGKKHIHIHMPQTESVNAIQLELETFAESINQNKKTKVSIDDGYRALKVAHEIIKAIEKNGGR
ncbi:MAG: Gfo/Idh/MocA family oxidoreductase [Saprospiraceae bacterium]|nr:Gfo/Idh/MocA family oxidoreductase [Saprospiraceae bacterium]